MKRWLLPMWLILLCQSAALAQQTANRQGQDIFRDAIRYLNGVGTSYDQSKAVSLFNEAAALGDGASLNALGNLHVVGDAGLEKDISKAVDYYSKAGSAGYSTAYYNLAMLYKDGQEISQDFKKSAFYCKEGADLGNNDCKKLLAYYYFKGFGVEQNYERAFQLYNQVAITGNANAEYFVGLCYRNGYGTIANTEEAKKWLLKAAAQGDYQAMHELTAEPQPENSNVNNPSLQQQVNGLKNYHEKLIAANTNDISGIYKGFAIYYDFSGEFVHQVVPLSLSIKQTTDGYEGKWEEGESTTAAIRGNFKNNQFLFDPESQYTRNDYYSYRQPELYRFKAAQLSISFFRDSMYLSGDMQFYSVSRREPGQPMYILLSKKVSELEGGAGALQLTINPNPVTTEIRAGFTLTKSSKVSFTVTGMDGRKVITQAGETLLPAGKYSIPINVTQLAQGNYNLQVTTSTGTTQIKKFIKI